MDPSAPDADLGTPRWVKVFGLVAVILVLLFAALHLAGRGLHDHGAPASVQPGASQR